MKALKLTDSQLYAYEYEMEKQNIIRKCQA